MMSRNTIIFAWNGENQRKEYESQKKEYETQKQKLEACRGTQKKKFKAQKKKFFKLSYEKRNKVINLFKEGWSVKRV